MRICIITGASSGLGKTYAEVADRTEKNIDEFWLIARRKERLEQVAAALTHPARVLPLDLTNAEHIEALKSVLREVQPDVGLFINCAGYGKIGDYTVVSEYDSMHMIDLNCKAAVASTLSVLPYMTAGDRIMEICSIASFQPIQHLNIYAASKAFLYSYTRALRMELLPRKIMVTAVCPYWVRDTEFIPVAKETGTDSATRPAIKSFPLAGRELPVVKRSLRASRIGFAVSTPSPVSFADRIFGKFLPKGVFLYLWELLRRV